MKIASNTLLNRREDDSFLKQSVQVVLGAGVLYLGFQGLRYATSRNAAERSSQSVEQKALENQNINSAAGLAVTLRDALDVTWYGNTDEDTIFRLFSYNIGTAEFLRDIALAYSKLTKGRSLLSDLYNYMDGPLEPWKPDWNQLNKRIQIIQKTHK
jgi:hypothetical protein